MFPKRVLFSLAALAATLSSQACMTIVVGRKASPTGHVIVGHNEDDLPPVWIRHGIVPARDWPEGSVLPATDGCNPKIPQVPHTLAMFWGEVKFADGDENADSFFNERGVLVVSNSGGNSRERMDDPSLLADGGIKFNLRRAVGERATSARDAVRIIGELVETYGYAPSARIYTVADANEAWQVQVVHGRNYVAVKCPDDAVTVMPNLYTVYDVAAWPKDEIVLSKDLRTNAVRKGFWDGKGPFDFAAAYQGSREWGPQRQFTHPSNDGRFPAAIRIITGEEWPKGKRFPHTVRPKGGMFSVADMKRLLTSHNEPVVNGVHRRESWSICQTYTIESSVWTLAPRAADTVAEIALGRGCERPYIACRPFGGPLPSELDQSSDAADRLAHHVRRHGVDRPFLDGLLRLPSRMGDVPELARAVDYVRDWLEARGVCVTVETNEVGRIALYASTVPGRKQDYLFVSHLDVVPAPDAMFVPRYEGDRFFARGACDTKGNAAMMCQVLANLAGRASVGLFLATDEEGGGGGTRTPRMMIDRGYLAKRLVLVGDTAGEEPGQLFTAEKGHARIHLVARGKGGHSSRPWALDNPIPRLCEGYLRFRAAWDPDADPNERWRTVLSPTTLQGSEANNIVPDAARMTLSCRYTTKAELERAVRTAKEATGLEVELEPGQLVPVENAPGDPEIAALLAAMDRGIPGGMREGRMSAATHASYYAGQGAPVVIFTATGGEPHSDREWGSLSSLDDYCDFFTDYFGRTK